jgi:hypothetical protein
VHPRRSGARAARPVRGGRVSAAAYGRTPGVVTVVVVRVGVVTTGVVTAGTVTDGTVAVGRVGTAIGMGIGSAFVASCIRRPIFPCCAGCVAGADAVVCSVERAGAAGGVTVCAFNWSSAFARAAEGTANGRLGLAFLRGAALGLVRRAC